MMSDSRILELPRLRNPHQIARPSIDGALYTGGRVKNPARAKMK